jgi:predicted nucleic acid-binding protein
MTDSAFLDTNVLVYAIDDSDPGKRDKARSILAAAEPGRLVVSTQVLSEFYVVATRKLERPLPEPDAAEAVDQLSRLPTVITDAGLVRSAIGISRSARISFWDALIVAAAAVGGCDRVLTEDLADGASIGPVKIENPFR